MIYVSVNQAKRLKNAVGLIKNIIRQKQQNKHIKQLGVTYGKLKEKKTLYTLQ